MKKILVVDDEEAVLRLFKLAFTKAGYEPVIALSGEEALEILKEEKILVIFSDLNLPGINGLDLCREIKKNIPMAIIYAVTGYASLFQLSDCRDAGFDDYFKKPVRLPVLLEAAEDAFNKIERWRKS
jgi:CheY-like chemotaxis protein